MSWSDKDLSSFRHVQYCIGPSHVLLLCGFVFLIHSSPHFLYFKCKCICSCYTRHSGTLYCCCPNKTLLGILLLFVLLTRSLASEVDISLSHTFFVCCIIILSFEKMATVFDKCNLTLLLGKRWLFPHLGLKAYPECFAAAVDLPIVVSESLMFSTSDIVG